MVRTVYRHIFLKHCSPSLTPTLILIINESLATGIVPDIFKVAKACPLFKNGDPYNARTYRLISLLPIISKLLEKAVRRQSVALVINNMQLMLGGRSVCGVVFADMNEAFDRVQHSTLILNLQELGVSVILKLFCSSLFSRFQ